MSQNVLFINNIIAETIIPELLTKAGYRVDIVYDSDTGLLRLETEHCDIVIVEESPRIESWPLCKKIRSLAITPIIVISPNASTETCVKAINAGADYFMRKPFGPLELLARIRSLLQRAPVNQPIPVGSRLEG